MDFVLSKLPMAICGIILVGSFSAVFTDLNDASEMRVIDDRLEGLVEAYLAVSRMQCSSEQRIDLAQVLPSPEYHLRIVRGSIWIESEDLMLAKSTPSDFVLIEYVAGVPRATVELQCFYGETLVLASEPQNPGMELRVYVEKVSTSVRTAATNLSQSAFEL